MPVGHFPLEGPGHHVLADTQKLGRGRKQGFARQRRVPVARRFGKHMLQPAARAQNRVVTESQFFPHRIGRLETDPGDIARQQIRIGPNARDRLFAVEFVDAQRAARADAVAVQENHDVAHHPLFGPRRFDLLAPPLPDPRHLLQAGRRIFDDVENFLAEFGHHLFGVNRTDSADQTAAQILFDALLRRRRLTTDVRGPQLHAVLAVLFPAPLGRDPLPGRDRGNHPDHRDQIAAALDLHLQDGKSGVLVVKSDPLDQPRQAVGGGRSFGGHPCILPAADRGGKLTSFACHDRTPPLFCQTFSIP